MTADTITAIKKALEGVTLFPGAWEVGELIKRRPYSHAWELQNSTDIFGYIYCGHEAPEDVKPVVEYIAAVNPEAISALLSTLESLQRENEGLKKDRYDLAYAITGGEDAPGLLDSVPTSQLVEIAENTHRSHSADIDRAMAAEDREEELRKSLVKAQADTTDKCPSCGGTGHYGDAAMRAINGDTADDTRDLLMSIEVAARMAEQGIFSTDGGQAAVEIRSLIPVRFRTALSSTGDTHGN